MPVCTRKLIATTSKDPSGLEWEALIAPAFFDFLDRLCTHGHQSDHQTASTPGLCEEIASWAGADVEAASFEEQVRIAARSSRAARQARLELASPRPRAISTVVHMFQRNPDVVAEVRAQQAGVSYASSRLLSWPQKMVARSWRFITWCGWQMAVRTR